MLRLRSFRPGAEVWLRDLIIKHLIELEKNGSRKKGRWQSNCASSLTLSHFQLR